jgi:hypothetical protein
MKMRKTFVFVITVMLVLGLSISTHAALIDLGGGMIYSTDLDLTWLQDANYARTSGYSQAQPDGFMTWNEANAWATTLKYGGVTGWRLPTFDPPPADQQCNGTFPPVAPTSHEMRYLHYTELGNNCSDPNNYGPFINVITLGTIDGSFHSWYWSGTSYLPPAYAWEYDFTCG